MRSDLPLYSNKGTAPSIPDQRAGGTGFQILFCRFGTVRSPDGASAGSPHAPAKSRALRLQVNSCQIHRSPSLKSHRATRAAEQIGGYLPPVSHPDDAALPSADALAHIRTASDIAPDPLPDNAGQHPSDQHIDL